jgi:hypothetical protein
MARFLSWAMPGIVFSVAFAFSACGDAASSSGQNCVPTGGATGAGGSGQAASSGAGGNPTTSGGGGTDGGVVEEAPGGSQTHGEQSFDHTNDPGESGQKDPFEILKERAEEGPPNIRTRLHSCTKIPYSAIGAFLTSRGVNMGSNVAKTAGQIYQTGGDALGVAKFDAREGERYFHTTAGATKLFDIFVQAAPEIIANIGNPAMAPACSLNGSNKPMFDAMDGSCVRDSLSCIMGRPATEDDLILCDLMLAQATPGDAADLKNKQNIAVAAFLSAAHTCE